MSSSAVVYTKETDYLDEDQPIRGQNYVCLSFLSPEDVIANKDVFVFQNYMKNVSKDVATLLDSLVVKYPNDQQLVDTIRDNYRHLFTEKEMQDDFRFFKNLRGDELDKEFAQANEFRTSVRGIKVRGVYDTLGEAQNRAQYLKRQGDKFDIFVAQVGCWCPWNPNPESIENVEYTEAQLNTLMKQYQENMTIRDAAFDDRKQQLMNNKQVTVEEIADDLQKPSPSTSMPESEQQN